MHRMKAGVSEKQEEVGFAEIEIDAPDNNELKLRYFVRYRLSNLKRSLNCKGSKNKCEASDQFYAHVTELQ